MNKGYKSRFSLSCTCIKVALHLRIFLRVLTDRGNRKTLRIPPESAMFTYNITYHIIYIFEIQTFTSQKINAKSPSVFRHRNSCDASMKISWIVLLI